MRVSAPTRRRPLRGGITRRALILAGAGVLAGLRPWSPVAATAAASHLRRSSYARLVGRSVGCGSLRLRLVAVTDVAGAARDRSLKGSEDAFVLAFSGPLRPALVGGTHTVTAPGVEAFELFVAPVGRPRENRRYEAVIDRSVR